MTDRIKEAFLKSARTRPAPKPVDEDGGHYCAECGGELHPPEEDKDEAPAEGPALDEDTKDALFAKALKEKTQ